jgi:hypothetical protein
LHLLAVSLHTIGMVANNNTTPHIADLLEAHYQARNREADLEMDRADIEEMLRQNDRELDEARLATAGIVSELQAMGWTDDEDDQDDDFEDPNDEPTGGDLTEISNSPVLTPEEGSSEKLEYDVNWTPHQLLGDSTRRKFGEKTIDCVVDTEKNIVTVKEPHKNQTADGGYENTYQETIIPIANQDVANCLTHVLNKRLNIEAQDKDFTMKVLFIEGEELLTKLAKAKVLRLQKGKIDEIVDARFSLDERVAVSIAEPASSEQAAS